MPLSIVETALAERTLALVDLPSPSHDEGLVYDYVRAALHHLPLAHDDGETLLYAKREGRPLVLLAGHTDTVPPQGNLPGRIEDGAVDGQVFREVLSGTQIHGGMASNVIPARCEALLNFRYAPGRTMDDAEARVRELVGLQLEIVDHAPAAHVPSRAPLVEKLRAAGGFDVQPKQAWTNVADFAARGLDAVNLGPGATRYAHAGDERVEIAELERTYDALRRFLTGSV